MHSDIYRYRFMVQSTQVDGALIYTPLAWVAMAQDIATEHWDQYQLSGPFVALENHTWIISRQHFEFEEYPVWKDIVESATWMQPPRGPFCYRNFTLSYPEGGRRENLSCPMDEKTGETLKPIIKGNSLWMLIDIDKKKPLKGEEAGKNGFPWVKKEATPAKFAKFQLPDSWDIEQPFTPALVDTDMNGHMNNICYIKYMLSWLPDSTKGKLIKVLDTRYEESGHLSDRLIYRCKQTGDEPVTLLHEIATDTGRRLFTARSVWDDEKKLTRPVEVLKGKKFKNDFEI